MNVNRREFVRSSSFAALGTAMTGKLFGITQAPATPTDSFDIDQTFVVFMKDIGGSPSDGGGSVTFTGRDPILRSHFRIGTSMALRRWRQVSVPRRSGRLARVRARTCG
jgi:hypothetical protein